MKRLLSILCVISLCLGVCGCGKKEETAPQISYEQVSVWQEHTAWDISFTSQVTMSEDGDTEDLQGYALTFDCKRIPTEKGNMYYAKYMGMNSALAFAMTYDYYWYDGWAYQLYIDSYTEELNEYCRYETPEEDFLISFDGVGIPVVTEEEFAAGEASVSEEGLHMISVPVSDVGTLNALTADIAYLAYNNGVEEEDVVVGNALVSYAVKDGKLYAYMGSYTAHLVTEDGIQRDFQMEKSVTVNAVNDGVETFTLPEDANTYEILEFEEE